MGKITEMRLTQKEITTGYECDCCGNTKNQRSLPGGWHAFSVGHHEWGNDSYESIIYYFVCSPKCYIKHMNGVLCDEFVDYTDGKADSMTFEFARKLLKDI